MYTQKASGSIMEFKIFIFLWQNVQTPIIRQLLHEIEFSYLPKLTLAKKQLFQQLPASLTVPVSDTF